MPIILAASEQIIAASITTGGALMSGALGLLVRAWISSRNKISNDISALRNTVETLNTTNTEQHRQAITEIGKLKTEIAGLTATVSQIDRLEEDVREVRDWQVEHINLHLSKGL